MIDWLSILLPAFLIGLIVVSTHTYFGLHILRRGIIFVDLALAQVSALGGIIAVLIWGDDVGHYALFMGLGFTFTAALFLAFLRKVKNKTTREVAIGCVYIVSMALGIVILSKTPHGGEKLKELLNGNMLWVTYSEIIGIGIVSAISLVLLYVFHNKFHQLSFEDSSDQKNTFLWELLFFILFALVISMAVQIVGVLMVFAYLILPAFAASMVVTTFKNQYILGGLFSVLITVIGGLLSVICDLPTGATIVSVLGLLPIITSLLSLRLVNRR